jgi:hypothetical protein
MRQSADGALGIVIMFQGLVRLFADSRIQHGVAGYWLIPSTPETAELIAAQRAFESESQQAIADALRRGVAAGQLDAGEFIG